MSSHEAASVEMHSSGTSHIRPLPAHLIAASGEVTGTFFFLRMGYSGKIVILNRAPAVAVTAASAAKKSSILHSCIPFPVSQRLGKLPNIRRTVQPCSN